MNNRKRLISVLLAAVMLFTLCAPAIADSGKYYQKYENYCCIGDSIAAGCGLLRSGKENKFDIDTNDPVETYNDNDLLYIGMDYSVAKNAYHSIVADELGAKLSMCARSGIRTCELRYLFDGVYNDFDKNHIWAQQFLGDEYTGEKNKSVNIQAQLSKMRDESKIISSVKKADILTVNIGANDVFSFTLIYMLDQLSKEMPELAKLMETTDINKLWGRVAKAASSADKLPDILLGILTNFSDTYKQYCENYRAILDSIYKLNPDVTVVSVGLYNPLKNVRLADGIALDISVFVQPLIAQMNSFLKGLASEYDNYYFADVPDTDTYRMNVTDPDVFELFILKVHPTIAGYKYMAKQILNVLPEGVAAPTLTVKAGSSASKSSLSWTKVSGADKYKVYRATSETGTYKLLTTTTKRTYTDTGVKKNTDYYYRVTAVKGSVESRFSNTVGYVYGLAVPTVKVSGNTDTGKPRLTWNKVYSAVKYEVWRATSKSGTYKKIKTTDKLSFTNTAAKVGTTYYYKVRAVNAAGKTSAFCDVLTRTCDCAKPVITVSSAASTGKLTVKWSKIEGAAKYEVWRATSKDGTYKKLITTTKVSYTDTSASIGSTYFYKVKAISSAKSAANSAYSAIVSRTRVCARPDVTAKRILGNPQLDWDAVQGAGKYIIYRAEYKDGTYTEIDTTRLTRFTDRKTDKKTTYYYKVAAVSSANSSAVSARSSVVSITTK